MSTKPKQIDIPNLGGIKQTHPEIGKAFEQLLNYIRKNVVPIQGNRKG